MAATVDIIGSRIGPITPLLVEHYGPIRETIKSTVAVTGTKKLKTIFLTPFPELETVLWTPHVKSVNSPFKSFDISQSSMDNYIITEHSYIA